MHSETPKLQPISPAFHLRILSDEQLEQLRSATFEILEEVGIQKRRWRSMPSTGRRWILKPKS
jgi:trimethylamine:corrinoid methyltransferase-like protein